ncbi:MAG: hypothetical protein ACP5U2_12150 [Bryobacteraceae bacterium]
MSERNHLEDLLRASLRRVEPPPGLQDRILAAARGRRTRRRLGWLRVAAAFVLVLLGTLSGLYWQHERVRARKAQEARRQLEFAIRLTNEQLAKAQRQLANIGVREIRVEEVRQ